MRRRIGFIAAWAMATLLSGWVAWAAVGFVGDSVAESPSSPLDPTEVASLPLSTAGATTTTPETTVSDSTAVEPTSTTTEATTVTSSTSTTSTSAPPASTTTSTTSTVPDDVPAISVYDTEGGSVAISISPGQVVLLWVQPGSGFSFEIEKSGPDEVRVEFTGEVEVEFRARWENGQLVVEIE